MTNAIYILVGQSNKKGKQTHYIGKTTRKIEKRIAEHFSGKSGFGSTHKNTKLLYFEQWDKVIFQLAPLPTSSDCEKLLKRIWNNKQFRK